MPAGDSALLLKIRSCLPSMSNAEQRIANNILEHPRDIVHLSITELAVRSQVSDATVVRFCRRLGMQGYQEMKVNLAQDLVSPIESIHEEVQETDSAAEVLTKVFASTMHTLEYTLRIIDKRQFQQALDAIYQAKTIHIYGCGNSSSVALDMQHKLMRLSMHATAYSDSHMQCIASTAWRCVHCHQSLRFFPRHCRCCHPGQKAWCNGYLHDLYRALPSQRYGRYPPGYRLKGNQLPYCCAVEPYQSVYNHRQSLFGLGCSAPS